MLLALVCCVRKLVCCFSPSYNECKILKNQVDFNPALTKQLTLLLVQVGIQGETQITFVLKRLEKVKSQHNVIIMNLILI